MIATMSSERFLGFLDKIPTWLWCVILIGTSVLLFGFILVDRSPGTIRQLSMILRTGFGMAIPTVSIILYLTFRMPGRLGQIVSLSATTSLFAFGLAGLWTSGGSQSSILSGLIPLNDAADYYVDALRLVNGGEFSAFSARRVLFPGLLSFLLFINGRNLMLALAILTWITAIASYLTSIEIKRTHGAAIAVFVLIILFLFFRIHSGASMSENLGFALGSIGFGLLWRGGATKQERTIFLGLITTTLALNARAGAFFSLPMLVIWAGWVMRANKPLSTKMILMGGFAVTLGFVLNIALTHLVATSDGIPFANFSYTLYGLAAGGKSWTYVFYTHPEILLLEEPEHSRRVYQLAWELIRDQPVLLMEGALFSWKMLFSNSWYNIYAYVGGENPVISLISRIGLYFLAIIGFFVCINKIKNPVESLTLLYFIGVFISVPFLPPTDAHRMRAYASSIVVLATLPALGFHYILSKIQKNETETPSSTNAPIYSLITYFNVTIILVVIFGPLIIRFTAKPAIPDISNTISMCTKPYDTVLIQMDSGNMIHIERQEMVFIDGLPNYHIGRFKRNAHSLTHGHLIQWAKNIKPSTTIFVTMDHQNLNRVMVVMPTKIVPDKKTVFQLCGQSETNEDLATYNIFYADEVHPLPP